MKKTVVETSEFHYIPEAIFGILKGNKRLADLYKRMWNPINYALIGGVGVGINYLIFALLIGMMPWFFTNIIAIICAWSWNWANSVGPLGFLWGFSKKSAKDVKT